MNKKKIFNDPVYGFISIPSDLIFDIINHPIFQRLRRISQLGLTSYVYPGALHTRFHHALGAMHLMGEALQNLRGKGHEISDHEFESAQIAILLHDIGHGPFSHALESAIMPGVHHEDLSLVIMERLNAQFNGAISTAIDIFNHDYSRPFLSQLVSSQLDIDRLDYLQRDCFFTGVSEGTIGASRIIKMLDVSQDHLVIEQKGIYSVENFLNARRLMYWQVYLHKTSVSAEQMLILLFKRAKFLASQNYDLFCTIELKSFLEKDINIPELVTNESYFNYFTNLDDYDIWGAIKIWKNLDDKILSTICNYLLERKLFKITLTNDQVDKTKINDIRENISKSFNIKKKDSAYLYATGSISNEAYVSKGKHINIISKKGEIKDVAQASDLPNIKAISKIVRKNFVCWPKK